MEYLYGSIFMHVITLYKCFITNIIGQVYIATKDIKRFKSGLRNI